MTATIVGFERCRQHSRQQPLYVVSSLELVSCEGGKRLDAIVVGWIPAAMLQLPDEGELDTIGKLYDIVVRKWKGGGVPQHVEGAPSKVMHKNTYLTECGNYRGISVVTHAVK